MCIFFIKPSNVSAFIEIILLFYNLYTYVSIFETGYKWKYMHNVMQNLGMHILSRIFQHRSFVEFTLFESKLMDFMKYLVKISSELNLPLLSLSKCNFQYVKIKNLPNLPSKKVISTCSLLILVQVDFGGLNLKLGLQENS